MSPSFLRLSCVARVLRILLGAAALLPAGVALAQTAITPAKYYECEILGREATLAGVEQRLQLVKRGADDASQRQAAELSRARVDQVFRLCGHSASTLAAYAHRHDEALQSWLAAHPEVVQRLLGIRARLDAAAAQFPAR